MDLLREIETATAKAEGVQLKLIDISISNNLVSYGEVRIENYDLAFDGKFLVGQEITVSAGIQNDGQTEATLLFTGVIDEIEEDRQIVLRLKGNGKKLLTKKFKRSFNKTTPVQILKNILTDSGITFELGDISNKRRHTFICPNGTLLEEIERVNNSFDLDLIPFFDRTGKLLLKTKAELTTKTDIVFEDDAEFKRFEENILETILDVEIDVFEEIEILGINYLVTNHRFFIDDQRTKSFISVETI